NDRSERRCGSDDAVPSRAEARGRLLRVHSGRVQRHEQVCNGVVGKEVAMYVNEHKIKQEICEIGRRLYAKGFAAANDGNITYRLNDKHILCTPTMVSKGFLKPDDICKVDYDGKQIAGTRKRSSEILLHLAVYKNRDDVGSVVHCH